MRSYANFILMENLVFNVPSSVASIKRLSEILFNPRVRIVERFCGTTIGTPISTLFLITQQPPDAQGNILTPYEYTLKVDGPIGVGEYPSVTTQEQISAEIVAKKNIIRVYHPSSCISTGGICSVCAYAADILSTAKVIDGATTTEYYDPPVSMAIIERAVGDTVQLQTSFGRVKNFQAPSQKALFSYIAGTFSGSLLGIQNFSNFPLPVKASLYDLLINDNMLALAQSDLQKIGKVPANIHEYIDTLDNKLEKAVLIVVCYVMYSSAEIAAITLAPDIVV